MRKRLNFIVLLLFTSIIFLGCSLESHKQVRTNQTMITEEKEKVSKSYDEVANEFNEVTSKKMRLFEQEEETFFVYTGRESCPFCQMFAPKLYEASLLNNNIAINYLNSDNKKDTGIDDYLSEHNIEYVPSLNYFKNGTLEETLQISSDIIINQISDFLTSK